MQLPLQNFTTLVQTMAAAVQGSASALIDLTTGSVLRAILEANASVGLWLQWLIMQVLSATRAATSAGPDLDSWVGDFGVTRLPAQSAATTLTFSRFTPGFAATIPVGAQAKTGDGTITFTVLADPTNAAFNALTNSYTLAASASSLSVTAQALVPGTAGNVLAGAVSLLATAMPGIDAVTNPATAAGGQEAESDAALRSRFTNFIDSRSRATPAAVAYTIESLQQGLTYVLAENADPSGRTRLGFFTITVDDGSGSPPATLITSVSDAIEAVRPLGSQFTVQPPTIVTANITLTMTTPANTHAAAQLAVTMAIRSFTSGLPIGATLPVSRLAAIAYAADPSISNVSAIAINGGGDLTPASTGVIKPGTITVN